MVVHAIEVDRLTKRFGDVTAVDNISFTVVPGEMLALSGPNGAGKTTTLQLLPGLTTPTSEVIRVLGLDVQRHRQAVLQRVHFSSAYIALRPVSGLSQPSWHALAPELSQDFGVIFLIRGLV